MPKSIFAEINWKWLLTSLRIFCQCWGRCNKSFSPTKDWFFFAEGKESGGGGGRDNASWSKGKHFMKNQPWFTWEPHGQGKLCCGAATIYFRLRLRLHLFHNSGSGSNSCNMYIATYNCTITVVPLGNTSQGRLFFILWHPPNWLQ